MLKILLLLLLPLLGFSQNIEDTHHCFFKPKSFTVGTSLSLNTKTPNAGFNVRTYYNIRENICFGPEYTISKNTEHKANQEFNFVFHYIFETKLLGIYPVAGYSNLKEETFLNGAIFGTGLHRNFNKLSTFLEYTKGVYQKDKKESKINIGILYSF